MKRFARAFATLIVLCLLSLQVRAQGSETYGSGMKVKLSDDGSKYFRLITWHQFWVTVQENANDELDWTPMLRRSRVLTYAQLGKRFLINTHFGLNNLTASGLHPTGQSSQAQLFFHDVWAEYTVVPKHLYVGGGLHYWNGLSRLTNQSTLNIMTLDAPRFNWPTIGLSDQFARHLGIYAKGKLGKLDYRLSVNQSLTNSLDDGIALGPEQTLYQNEGGEVINAYLNYQFFDQEGNLLPYMVGSYLGTKRVLNVGAGFNYHGKGTRTMATDSAMTENNVLLLAADVFYDAPIGENGGAISAYAVYYNFDFGPNYLLQGTSNVIGTGSVVYGQAGYVIPKFSEKVKLMPYATYSHRMFEANSDPASTLGVGVNAFLDGHHCKVTLEYQNTQDPAGERTGRFILQGMIYL